ncbi:MAG: alpha/beta hydrolase [Cyanobacteriota bacterium]|nr:alpha/beta hydrolase [Cyanobacteriota bacterium]
MNNSRKSNWFQAVVEQFSFLNKGVSKLLSLSLAVLLAITASVTIFSTHPAHAIDGIRIKYGAINLPITVEELVDFANTGNQSDQLRSLFLTANASEEAIQQVRDILSYQVEVDPGMVDDVLRSRYGRLVLNELGRYFGSEDVDAIVNEVIASVDRVIGDGQIKVMEVIRRFEWADTIVIDGDGIVDFFKEGVMFGREALQFVKNQPAVQQIVCDRSM